MTLDLFKDYAAKLEAPANPPAKGSAQAPEQTVWRVSELNKHVRLLLEKRVGLVCVEGELSDVKVAGSGHVYFTLNDDQRPAQLRGVMFRSDVQRCVGVLEEGAMVRVQGAVSLYEARGSFQIVARHAEPAGTGALYAAFLKIRAKLEAEGLLSLERKRSLPRVPHVVGVVTSESGAALQDIIRVARNRFAVRLVVAPCLVQGVHAPASIVQALHAIAQLPDLDVVIIGRGGGSAEDLFAFNDELVARTIAACPVPIVSAVGHEVDITIADLVADLRAATPSNAAELVVPEREVLAAELANQHRRLERAMELGLGRKRLGLERLLKSLPDPSKSVSAMAQRLVHIAHELRHAWQQYFVVRRQKMRKTQERLAGHDPSKALLTHRARLHSTTLRLRTAIHRTVDRKRSEIELRSTHLEAISPLGVLKRGYAIVTQKTTGEVLRGASQTKVNDPLHLRLHEGTVQAVVTSTKPKQNRKQGP